MSEWKLRRFWREANTRAVEGGFAVELDGRAIRTPAKALLQLPTEAMARAVAAEWDAQQGTINPLAMPFTRSANAAIDKVTAQHGQVADMLAAYGDSDLLCYRAETPVELVQRQTQEWDPPLDWAADALGARLVPRAGIIHHPQDPGALARLSARVHAMSPFQLAAFHDLVSLSGSLVLGLAAAMNWRSAETLWAVSRLDEQWQEDQWGRDDDAHALAESRRLAFLHAKNFFDMA